MVELVVLARGDVALAQRRVLLGDDREGLELVRGDGAEGELHADHLAVGLALAVDALLQPEADELVLRTLPFEECRGLGAEVLKLLLEDRDHAAGCIVASRRGHGLSPCIGAIIANAE